MKTKQVFFARFEEIAKHLQSTHLSSKSLRDALLDMLSDRKLHDLASFSGSFFRGNDGEALKPLFRTGLETVTGISRLSCADKEAITEQVMFVMRRATVFRDMAFALKFSGCETNSFLVGVDKAFIKANIQSNRGRILSRSIEQKSR